jgi:hypothetical protein
MRRAKSGNVDASSEYVKVLREVDIRRANVETQPEYVDALLTTWRHPSAPTPRPVS